MDPDGDYAECSQMRRRSSFGKDSDAYRLEKKQIHDPVVHASDDDEHPSKGVTMTRRHIPVSCAAILLFIAAASTIGRQKTLVDEPPSTQKGLHPILRKREPSAPVVAPSANVSASGAAAGDDPSSYSPLHRLHQEYEETLPRFVCPSSSDNVPSSESLRTSKNWMHPSVVILAGPHKTGTTSTQVCMVDWTTPDAYMPQWSWPVPSDEEMNAINLRGLGAIKNFASFFGVLSKQTYFILDGDSNVDALEEFDRSKMVDLYRTHMLDAWNDGKNIVFGSEQMDWIVSNTLPPSVTEDVRNGALEILPWKSQHRLLKRENIEAVINYRSPRVEHFLSIWKEEVASEAFLMASNDTSPQMREKHMVASQRTFREFLSQPNANYFMVNSLSMALRLLDVGIRTTVIDLSGIAANGQPGLCHVVACDVMGGNCTSDGRLAVLADDDGGHQKPDVSQEPLNARTHKEEQLGLTPQEIDSINDIVTEYDCGLKASLLEYAKCGQLRIIHRHDLFRTCGDHPSPVRQFSWVIEEIQKVVR